MPIWVGVAKALIRTGIAKHIPSIQRLMGDGLPYLKYYNRRILGSPNVELRQTQILLDHAKEDVIDLSLGAPTIPWNFEPPPHEQSRSNSYPPVGGLRELRDAIARKLHLENGIHVDPEHQVLVCNGVSQGIGLTLDTFVDPGERVVVFDPSFFVYRMAAQNRGARVIAVPTWLESGETTFSDRELGKALRGAKVIFLNSPANPTGGILTPEALERIAWWCDKRDVLIFSDEVYERFLYSGTHISIASLPRMAERTITANSFSKSHGMAGGRVGFLAGPRYLIQPMIVSCLATAPFVSAPAQRMALAALNHAHELFEPTRAEYRSRRDFASAQLKRAGLDHEVPAGAFYIWAPITSCGIPASEVALRLLAEQKVLIMPGDSCGKTGKDFIRISYTGSRTQLAEGMRRIAQFFGESMPTILPFPDQEVGQAIKRRTA